MSSAVCVCVCHVFRCVFCVQQGQGEVSSSVQTDADTDPDGDGDGDSDAEPRQVRSQWAKQLKPLIICSHFSPSPTKEEDEEDEEDFHPQSLDSILGEEEKVRPGVSGPGVWL